MKKFLKTLTVAIVCLSCVISLASCKGGIDTKNAKSFTEDFFSAIEAEDYETAKTFLHPERPADLEPFFTSIEKDEGIDFQQGIEIDRYVNFSYSYYDSTVDGSTSKPTIRTKVGNTTVTFTIEIVQNDNGYGIYNLDIDT